MAGKAYLSAHTYRTMVCIMTQDEGVDLLYLSHLSPELSPWLHFAFARTQFVQARGSLDVPAETPALLPPHGPEPEVSPRTVESISWGVLMSRAAQILSKC